MSNLIHQKMSYTDLAQFLRDMAQAVEAGDSFEGNIEYLMPLDNPEPGTAMVRGVVRIGNRSGQGSVMMIGTVPGVTPP